MCRQSDNPHTAYLWIKISFLWPFTLALTTHFALIFTEREKLFRNKLTYFVIYAPALVFSLLDATTGLIAAQAVKEYWGYTYSIPRDLLFYWINLVWVAILGFLAPFLSWRYSLQVTDKKKKKQAEYVTIGLLLPALFGILTEGLLPVLHIRIPEMTTLFMVSMSIFIVYAIVRYELFVLTPATAAENIISTMNDCLILSSPDGKILQVNQSLLNLLGYKENELIEKPLDILFPREGEFAKEILKKSLENERLTNYETKCMTKLDREFDTIVSASVVKDKEKKITGVVITATNITERKQMEETLKQSESKLRKLAQEFDAILNTIPDNLTLQSTDLRIIWANKGAADGLGKDIPDLLGQPCYKLWYNRSTPCEFDSCPVQKTFRTGNPQSKETQTPDGRYWDLRTFPIKDEKGTVISVVEVGRNITERKKVEEAVKSSEEYARNIINSSLDMIIAVDKERKIVEFNQAAEEIFGYSREEILGKHINMLYTDSQEGQIVHQTTSGEGKFVGEVQNKRKNGEIFVSFLSAAVMRNEKGVMLGVVGVSRDITERKRLEEALKKSKELLEKTFLALDRAIFILDSQIPPIILDCNPAASKIFGYEKQEMIGKTTEFLHVNKKTLLEFEEILYPVIDKQGYLSAFEFRMKRKNGEVFPTEHSVLPLKDSKGNRIGWVSVVSDITERKKAENALRESEENYRLHFENINDVVYSLDPNFRVLSVSPSVERVLGYKPEELTGRPFQELNILAPEYLGKAFSDTLSVLAGGRVTSTVYEFIAKNGTRKFGEISGAPLVREGKIVGVVSIGRDITERKKMEEELLRLRKAVETSGEVVFITNREGIITFINPEFTRLYGYTAEEVVDKVTPRILKSGKMKPEEHEIFWNTLLNKQVVKGELINKTKDGRFLNVEGSASPILDEQDGIIGFLAIQRDITERKKMEEELIKLAKLESLGTLAGGIAHDFNNILTSILGNISLAKINIDTGAKEETQELLSEAEKASLQARNLTQQLLTFSKGGEPIKKVVSLGELLKEAVSFALRGYNIRAEFSIPDDLWAVEIDEGQITQVINNIVLNAQQSMPEGGTIWVDAENSEIAAEKILTLKGGKYAKFSIKDKGIGISEEHLSKIFDPYFTTKQKGSGLGLATSYSIIKKHNGHISAESEVGVGSIFTIYLPASPEETIGKWETKERLILGKGKILVMDDEDSVRKFVQRLLKRLGYEVELTKDGMEAIELYQKAKESGNPFSVVILDLTVTGGMGGKETIKKLKEIDPEVKAIVSSGYSNDPIMSEFEKYGFIGVLTKPYEIMQMSKLLNEIVDKQE